MRHRYRLALLALLVPPAAHAQTALPLKHTPRPTAPAITAADLMTRAYVYADDSMQGREAGTIGNVKATEYIAAELRRLGLVPAGDNGSYFQTIPLKIRTFDTTSTFMVGGTALVAFTDYLLSGRQPGITASLPIVFAGVVADTAHYLAADQLRGTLAVFALPSGANTRRLLRGPPPVPGAAAYALIAPDTVPQRFRAFATRSQAFLDDDRRAPPALIVLLTRAAAAQLFPTPLDQLAPGAAGATAALDLRFQVEPAPYPARNVVAIIPGGDPKLKGQYVAIGAHNDHIGLTQTPVDHDSLRIWNQIVRPAGADDAGRQATPAQQAAADSALAAFRAAHPGAARPDSISNGADDDGSGSVSVLEIAERIASLAPKPRRSTLFVWHTAEETGLLGSRYFADHPTVPRDSIVAQLNLDMVGRGGADDEAGRTKDRTSIYGGPRYLQLVGSRRLSTELGDLVEQVNTQGRHHLSFDYSIDADGHPSNIYCRSDHYHYARYGIPIIFFTTGLHVDYHQVTDQPEYIDYEHMMRIANLVADVAVHVADLDHRPVVDHPKPDPNAPCRQ